MSSYLVHPVCKGIQMQGSPFMMNWQAHADGSWSWLRPSSSESGLFGGGSRLLCRMILSARSYTRCPNHTNMEALWSSTMVSAHWDVDIAQYSIYSDHWRCGILYHDIHNVQRGLCVGIFPPDGCTTQPGLSIQSAKWFTHQALGSHTHPITI